MARIVLATSNWLDAEGLVISASDELASAPVTNLLRIQPTDVWQTAGLAGLTVEANRLDLAQLNLIALLFTNATSGASWRVRCRNQFGAEIYDNSRKLLGAVQSSDGFAAMLRFDGDDDRVTVGPAVPLTLSTFTLEFHVRPKVVRRQGLVALTGGTVDAVVAMTVDGRIRFVGLPGLIGDLVSTTVAEADEWMHVAVVYDASAQTMRLYINGVEEDSASGIASLSDSDSVELGVTESVRLWGDLDEVRLWSVARSASAILASVGTLISAPTAGLVGYWKLDDGTGTSATDSSGNGNSGTLSGGPTWAYPRQLWASSGLDNWDRTHALEWIPAGVSAQDVVINIIDNENPDGHFRAGCLIVSGAWQPPMNARWGASPVGIEDPSLRERTIGGETVVTPVASIPVQSFVLQAADPDDPMGDDFLVEAEQLLRLCGARRPVLVVFDPDEGPTRHAKMVYGLMGARLSAIQSAFAQQELAVTVTGML